MDKNIHICVWNRTRIIKIILFVKEAKSSVNFFPFMYNSIPITHIFIISNLHKIKSTCVTGAIYFQ